VVGTNDAYTVLLCRCHLLFLPVICLPGLVGKYGAQYGGMFLERCEAVRYPAATVVHVLFDQKVRGPEHNATNPTALLWISIGNKSTLV